VDKKTREDENPILLCNYTDVYYNEYITERIDFMQASANDSQIRKFKLEAGDTIITKDSETPKDIAVPAYVPINLPNVICGYHLAQIKPNEELVLGEFIFRCFQSTTVLDQYSSRANGITRFGLTVNAIGEAIFPVPPIEEQLLIIRYIKSETSRLDQLITNKQRLIELFQEKRQALITQAVTKGLDPTVPMKDSGVEWLREISKKWEIRKLKYVVKTKLQYGANESGNQDIPDGIRYIRITDFDSEGILRDNDTKYLEEEAATGYLLNYGDILFARSGATVGKTFQYKDDSEKACFAGYLIRATPNENICLSDFLYYFTLSKAYENWKNMIFSQATIQNIGADKYKNLLVPLPQISEQNRIVSFLHTETSTIFNLITKLTNQIELIDEYRQTLITNTVTGKIDVRGEGN
jgi:type I restriction enzyme S subunit